MGLTYTTAAQRDVQRTQHRADRFQPARLSLAGASGRAAPEAMPLVTAADLATLKPFLCVRTRQEFRREVLLYACLYVLAFLLVPLVWWRRGVRGDRLVLAVAHLLTAIGFAALLSRPDPLRDTLLFVRFTEGTISGLLVMTAVSLVDFGRMGFA